MHTSSLESVVNSDPCIPILCLQVLHSERSVQAGGGRRPRRQGHRQGDVRRAGHAVRLPGAPGNRPPQRRRHGELLPALRQHHVRRERHLRADAQVRRPSSAGAPQTAVRDDSGGQVARTEGVEGFVPDTALRTQEEDGHEDRLTGSNKDCPRIESSLFFFFKPQAFS